jgi:isoamylase
LRRSRFLTGRHDEALDLKDVTWINANGHEMQDANWKDASMKCFGMMLDGRAQKTGIKRRGEDKTVLIVMNSYEGLVDFTFPKCEVGEGWSLLIDTNIPDAAPEAAFEFGSVYQVTGRSLLLFAVKAV